MKYSPGVCHTREQRRDRLSNEKSQRDLLADQRGLLGHEGGGIGRESDGRTEETMRRKGKKGGGVGPKGNSKGTIRHCVYDLVINKDRETGKVS